LKRTIIKTGDGSVSIYLPDWDEQYHSKHGAVVEAQHVYIGMGLHHIIDKSDVGDSLSVLEIGFGTGLNAYLTVLEAENKKVVVNYTGVEAYPLSEEEIKAINYAEMLKTPQHLFDAMHQATWEEEVSISEYFHLCKRQQLFDQIVDKDAFHLIYYDAFGARVQPELWGEAIFLIMYNALKIGGVLVTYAAKGSARRAMETVGFAVERLPGPPRKREMLRATKV
jgi:tRNA U34 5-methylaminomethyl-2-thiouridine-forming methyltransferase MnmC